MQELALGSPLPLQNVIHYHTTGVNTDLTLSPSQGQQYTCICWQAEGYRTTTSEAKKTGQLTSTVILQDSTQMWLYSVCVCDIGDQH